MCRSWGPTFQPDIVYFWAVFGGKQRSAAICEENRELAAEVDQGRFCIGPDTDKSRVPVTRKTGVGIRRGFYLIFLPQGVRIRCVLHSSLDAVEGRVKVLGSGLQALDLSVAHGRLPG
jgi:hypothetical protein